MSGRNLQIVYEVHDILVNGKVFQPAWSVCTKFGTSGTPFLVQLGVVAVACCSVRRRLEKARHWPEL